MHGFLFALVGQATQAFERAALADARWELAETLQRSLLPGALPSLPRLALAACYLPGTEGTEAGGDWYDVVSLGADRVALVVGDVVGCGPAAAAVMGQLRSAQGAYLLEGHSPSVALEHLDRFATRIAGSTVTCAIVDSHSGELCWARAGHPPPLIAGDGEPRFLSGAHGTPLGVRARPTPRAVLASPAVPACCFTPTGCSSR